MINHHSYAKSVPTAYILHILNVYNYTYYKHKAAKLEEEKKKVFINEGKLTNWDTQHYQMNT